MKHFFLPTMLLFGSLPLYASETLLELNPITVTETRATPLAKQSLSSVTVITRADIERKQALSVQDILKGVVGVGIANSGGLGKTSSVFMRGTNSDHVLVLIDGLRVSSASLGTAAFQDIPIDQIERIEIVKGPRSSLYGSDAIGGVIQIFTRKGQGELSPYLSLGGGSHGTYKVAGGVSGSIENGWYSFNASRLETDGFNACRGAPFPNGGGCFTTEPDKDAYTNTAGSLRAGYRFSDKLELEGHFMHSEGDNDFDGSFVNESTYVQQVVGGKLRYSVTDFWDIKVVGGRTRDQNDNFLNKDMTSHFNTDRYNISLQNDFSIGTDHLFSLGYDYYNDVLDSDTDYRITSRDNMAGFGQYQGQFGHHDLILGIRFDQNEQFDGQVTGNAAWGYSLNEYLRVTAGFGSAFKAPSFNELYFPDFGSVDLDPEESRTWEVGFTGKLAEVNWSLSGFYTEIDDLIASVADENVCAPPFFFCAQNIDKAQIFGLEIATSTTLLGVDIAANVTLLNPENRGNGTNKGNLLARRAEQMFRLDLDRRFDQISTGLSVYGEGRRFDDLANTTRLGGYVLLDLRAGIDFYKHWSLEGRVNNVLDKGYETAYLFNQDGRNFFVTLHYRP